MGSFSLGGGLCDERSTRLREELDPSTCELEPEHRPRIRGVASRIRQCLLDDPVDGDTDTRRDPSEVSSHAQLDGKTSRPCLVDERGNLARRGNRRRRARLVVAAE